jgi:hypothetical protein
MALDTGMLLPQNREAAEGLRMVLQKKETADRTIYSSCLQQWKSFLPERKNSDAR